MISKGIAWLSASQRSDHWLTNNSCRWSDSRRLQELKNYRVRANLLLLFHPVLCFHSSFSSKRIAL